MYVAKLSSAKLTGAKLSGGKLSEVKLSYNRKEGDEENWGEVNLKMGRRQKEMESVKES